MNDLGTTIRDRAEIDHQLAADLETHALYVAVIVFVILVALLLTGLVLDDVRRRRKARNLTADEAEAQRRRQRGIDEGFRRGFHG